MIQGAYGLDVFAIAESLSVKFNSVIFAVAKVAYAAQQQTVVQDPNAIKEQKAGGGRTFDWMEQDYLLVSEKLCVTSLKVTRDIADRSFICMLVENL